MVFFKLFFFFFPHLIYLPQLIVDKKRISVIFKRKGKEIVNWHKNEGFPLVSKGKRVELLHIKSRIYPAYIFMNTVKNVVRNADISTSFYFIKYWALCLSRENINLNWENIYIIFFANSASSIFLDAVQEKLLEFLSGQF